MPKILCEEIVTTKLSTSGTLQIGIFTWPSGTPPAGSVLKTDGAGNLVFQEINIRTPVDALATTYTIGITEDIVAITGTLNTTLTLPDPSTKTIGETIYIVKEVAGTSVITINPFNTELISGNATYTFSDAYQSVRLYTNGTNWFII